MTKRQLTDHYSRRYGVPLEPEGDEGAGHQDDTRNEDRREVEGTISREYQIHLQAAVVTYHASQQLYHNPTFLRFVRGESERQ